MGCKIGNFRASDDTGTGKIIKGSEQYILDSWCEQFIPPNLTPFSKKVKAIFIAKKKQW